MNKYLLTLFFFYSIANVNAQEALLEEPSSEMIAIEAELNNRKAYHQDVAKYVYKSDEKELDLMARNLIAINKLSGNEDSTPKYNSKNKNDMINFIKSQTGAD